jgi:hypothetical protein
MVLHKFQFLVYGVFVSYSTFYHQTMLNKSVSKDIICVHSHVQNLWLKNKIIPNSVDNKLTLLTLFVVLNALNVERSCQIEPFVKATLAAIDRWTGMEAPEALHLVLIQILTAW